MLIVCQRQLLLSLRLCLIAVNIRWIVCQLHSVASSSLYLIIRIRSLLYSINKAGLRYCGALSTWQSRPPLGRALRRGAASVYSPSPAWGLGLCPQKIYQTSTSTLRIFSIFASWNGLFCCGIKAGIELKYITKITSIIGSDKILNRPRVCSQPPTSHPICLLSNWAKRECTFWFFAAYICSLFKLINL